MSTEIRIVGVDEDRAPKIHKEPYIDLYFKLSPKAPSAWCSLFNDIMAKHPSSPKIKDKEGLFIETWVRKPEEVPEHLKLLKTKVAECSQRYDDKLRAEREDLAGAGAGLKSAGGEQGRLNRIIEELEFDAPPEATRKIAS